MTFPADALPAVMELLALGLLTLAFFAVLTLWQTAQALRTRRLIDTADHVIETVVCSLMQSVVDDIKVRPCTKAPSARSSDSRLTPEEADQVKRVAVARARELLGQSLIKQLDNLFQNFELYLSDRIEFYVRNSRSAQ